MVLLLSVSKTPDQEQAITCAYLYLLSSTKLNQQSRDLNTFVHGFSTGCTGWVQQWWSKKQIKLADDKDTIKPSQRFQKQT